MNILKYASETDKVIGLYFSAAYCPSCTVFTPQLSSLYPYIREKNIEIIFVASDKTKEAFDLYHAGHPWPAINYNDPIRSSLRSIYGVKTIPALIFIDKEQNIVDANGRDSIVDIIKSSDNEKEAAEMVAMKFGLSNSEYDSDASDF